MSKIKILIMAQIIMAKYLFSFQEKKEIKCLDKHKFIPYDIYYIKSLIHMYNNISVIIVL